MLLSSYPKAIVHIDADAFFASVSQVIHPELAGKPVVTGANRGVAIAVSYEAKAKGVKRGMLVHEARKLCPGLVAVTDDFESYGLFSQKMFAIIKRFTPQVEEHSIDEAFADLTGLRRLYRKSYPQIALDMKETIERELGLTVSVGLSCTKGLAKLASKYNKPSGFVPVPGRQLEDFLKDIQLDQVWGFGTKSVALLNKHGIRTVLEFVSRPQSFAKKLFGKVGDELWKELSGTSVNEVCSIKKSSYASISKFKTFSPPSTSPEYVFAHLLRNLERASAKMRRFDLATRKFFIVLRRQSFVDDVLEITLSRFTRAILDLVKPVKERFDKLFKSRTPYRATGVILCELKEDKHVQLNIFEDPVKMIKARQIDNAVDAINRQFGRQTVHLGDTLPVMQVRSGQRESFTKAKKVLPTVLNYLSSGR